MPLELICRPLESHCIALCCTPAASASVLFGTARSVLCLCVFVFCFAGVHQIKAVEHHNWLLHHHFSDMRLATERQMQRHRPWSQRVELNLSTILNWYWGWFGQTDQWLCCLHISPPDFYTAKNKPFLSLWSQPCFFTQALQWRLSLQLIFEMPCQNGRHYHRKLENAATGWAHYSVSRFIFSKKQRSMDNLFLWCFSTTRSLVTIVQSVTLCFCYFQVQSKLFCLWLLCICFTSMCG